MLEKFLEKFELTHSSAQSITAFFAMSLPPYASGAYTFAMYRMMAPDSARWTVPSDMFGIWCHGLILSMSSVMCSPFIMSITSTSPQPVSLANMTAGMTLAEMAMPRMTTLPPLGVIPVTYLSMSTGLSTRECACDCERGRHTWECACEWWTCERRRHTASLSSGVRTHRRSRSGSPTLRVCCRSRVQKRAEDSNTIINNYH